MSAALSGTASPEPGRPPFTDASPAQIRAALIPEEAAEFDDDWRRAMVEAAESLDLTEVFETLESWRRIAWLTVAAGADGHREMYRRAASRFDGQDTPPDEPLARTKARLGL